MRASPRHALVPEYPLAWERPAATDAGAGLGDAIHGSWRPLPNGDPPRVPPGLIEGGDRGTIPGPPARQRPTPR
jgi:hypothetical protein